MFFLYLISQFEPGRIVEYHYSVRKQCHEINNTKCDAIHATR